MELELSLAFLLFDYNLQSCSFSISNNSRHQTQAQTDSNDYILCTFPAFPITLKSAGLHSAAQLQLVHVVVRKRQRPGVIDLQHFVSKPWQPMMDMQEINAWWIGDNMCDVYNLDTELRDGLPWQHRELPVLQFDRDKRITRRTRPAQGRLGSGSKWTSDRDHRFLHFLVSCQGDTATSDGKLRPLCAWGMRT